MECRASQQPAKAPGWDLIGPRLKKQKDIESGVCQLCVCVFLVPGYKPEGPIESGLSVRQLVSPLVRHS